MFQTIPSQPYESGPMRHNRPILPAEGPGHQWVCMALFSVSQAAVERSAQSYMAGQATEGLTLDHENIMSVMGPRCLKCEIDMTPGNYASQCPIQITVVHGPDCGNQH